MISLCCYADYAVTIAMPRCMPCHYAIDAVIYYAAIAAMITLPFSYELPLYAFAIYAIDYAFRHFAAAIFAAILSHAELLLLRCHCRHAALRRHDYATCAAEIDAAMLLRGLMPFFLLSPLLLLYAMLMLPISMIIAPLIYHCRELLMPPPIR